jgi:DNA (cytosine-5)-methyltransferase 1
LKAYYNEHDKFAAQWLRNLIAAGHITPGDVDERDIQEVKANDVKGFTQVHLFAGIGGWSYALRLAGWPDARPVWTGSAPCQPFSTAGQRKGKADARHLWPEMYRLIRERKPGCVFGEQVAAAIGAAWLDTVSDDMEAAGYAIGAIVLPACSVGAPHIRQRLWFVGALANAESGGGHGEIRSHERQAIRKTVGGSFAGELADALHSGRPERRPVAGNGQAAGSGESGGVEHAAGEQVGISGCAREQGGAADIWQAADWLPCRDGKARPVEPGTFPLAHGLPARVGRLRGYGNAIVPQVAEQFIRAYMECQP